MALDLNGAVKEVENEKVHTLHMQTPQGVAAVKIPHSKMKRCPCGCDRFVPQANVGYIKPPVLGAEPLQITTPVFVCAECGVELAMTHPQVGDPKLVEG